MRRTLKRLGGARISLAQLLVISASSSIVSALIVVSALGETAPERAVIAALNARQVIHAAGGSSTSPAATPPASTPAPDPAPSAAPDSGGGGDAGASDAGSDSGNASSDASTASSGSSDSSATSDTTTTSSSSTSSPPASKVKHLFVIALSTPSYAAAFGQGSAATYLNAQLRPKGELLSGYRTLGAAPLPDLLAMVSGQAPNRDTTAGCATYSDFRTGAAPAADGLVPGPGCVYPTTALTIGDQLDGADLPWRAYVDGMTAPCVHPDSGAADDNVTGVYATARNPFVYFHSLLDLGDCQQDDLPFGKEAAALLHSASKTPSYAFISPGPCESGASGTCPVGQATGIAAADAFLKRTVPAILGSAAYRASGALVIVFTATPASTTGTSSTSTTSSTTSTSSTTTTAAASSTTTAASTAAAGGADPVRTGALVLSPFTKAGSTDAAAYDPYSILRTAEDVFALSKLARAKSAHGFDTKVFSSS